MLKMKLFISAVFLLLLKLSNTQENEKQSKIRACIKISKARILTDPIYFKDVLASLSQEVDEAEATNKIMTLILLNCYNKISLYDADDINRQYKSFRNIPALDSEYKSLLELEKWHELLTTGDKERIQEEMENLSEALKEIKSEDLNFEDDETNVESDDRQNQDDFYVSPDKKTDFSIFGFNFTKLNSFTKHLIGISLIVFIFGLVIYGLIWIKNLNKKEKKERKKK